MHKNILLIHSPFKKLSFGDHWQGTESLAPPLGLMYLATPLIGKGYAIDFLDMNVDRITKQEFKNIILKNSIIGLTTYSDSLKNVKKIITMIRTINPKAVILCGGPYCNLSKKYIEGSDLVFVGEAESLICEILEAKLSRGSLEEFPGLIYNENGVIRRTDGILELKDLDANHPSLELAKAKLYGYFFNHKILNITGIMSSRGCPFQCTYCTHKGILNYRERSVHHVVKELKELSQKGFKYIIFYDDNFLLNKKRVVQIMNHIVKEKLKIKMIVQGRVESADMEFYRLLRKAGVVMIMFGIENANQDILDFYKKGTNIETIKRAIELCNKSGIITFGYMILGAPMENKEHFMQNKKFVNAVALDYININILGYYQGSKLWHDAVNAGLINENETVVYANQDLSQYSYEEWWRLKTELLDHFYSKKTRILRFGYKLLKLGMLPDIVKILWHARGNLFTKFKSPFIAAADEEKIYSE
jgi:anaerobic magnesium-protoporphyrin IX monomethyl ester cyclase